MNPSKLRIFDRRSPVKVLGPFSRAVIWVQGCDFGCKGCIVPESWDRNAGEDVDISELVDWILNQPSIEGITLSGGEPMLQAEAMSTLIDRIRTEKDLGVMCYTGFRLEHLKEQGTTSQTNLLKKIDLLIDGVYVENLQDDLLWRGSSNQRLLLLSDRYREFLEAQGDRSAGLEFFFAETGEVGFSGVPAQLNFRQEFESRMSKRSVIVNPK
ncbi:MAG: radical SAM protein [Microcoleus sp. PH2017_10_PVI_O_A]|uniref:4Fe-4S single cluster domain-containing protein n=1 Tax=unclassified Microcoleus TaxID=2642155 RepID=UPI001DF17137|nr:MULTISPECIES: 4Fe-4S single cluster domain-containing protein [unclassified Microcoleus]TAE82281.1 MAG: radical SAM protein [Oscillatoriales cyanobacterium]MCC3406803.1 radical SAM protein [Microcoleus sp. PH2017_10_PVI_O_A]MCC3460938.1 radical SAM protein [Microcoleus sp. PH2017_11_PCY_U_A]MCC3479460.1 radical SAM protein [Microcoleus sp. PH2017_12_PCY_D_A]MCC3560302.1 radical SAM protein [Microcoleus sp. PH2017_27_LUM_O_A]